MMRSIAEVACNNFRRISRLWHKHKPWKRRTYCGVPILKNPMDLWVYQEILWRVRPELVIEIGTYKGGSALYLSHVLDRIGHGHILSIDIKPRHGLPKSQRITYLVGDCLSDEILRASEGAASESASVLVIEDSAHTYQHVRKVLDSYAPFVTPESYFIVEDTYAGGPHRAAQEFIASNRLFERDLACEDLMLTCNPDGFLRRLNSPRKPPKKRQPKAMQEPPCQCPLAGFCPRYQRQMSDHLHNLCQTRADYRRTFTATWCGPKKPKPPQRTDPCIYLGRIVQKADEAGKPCRCPSLWVRLCEVHGQCSLGDIRNEHACTNCQEYEAK